MSLCRKLFCRLCIHHIPQEEKLVMEMLNGVRQRTPVFPAIGKCPGNADGSHGIQSVRVLYDLSFQSIRDPSTVPAERNGINTRTDFFSLFC